MSVKLIWLRIQIYRKKATPTKQKSILPYVWVLPENEEKAEVEQETKNQNIPKKSEVVKGRANRGKKSVDAYLMPDSGRENGELEIDRIETRIIANLGHLITTNGNVVKKVLIKNLEEEAEKLSSDFLDVSKSKPSQHFLIRNVIRRPRANNSQNKKTVKKRKFEDMEES